MNRLARHAPVLGLLLLIAGVSATNLEWLRMDDMRMPHTADPYIYLHRMLRVGDALENVALTNLWGAMGYLTVGGRPVVYQLLTLPFVPIFGRSSDAALAVNFLFQALLLVAVYAIGHRVRGPWAGLLAALLVASYPPIAHLSRTYRPHFAVPACAAVSLWLLLRVVDRRSVRDVWLWGGSLAFGLLVHPYFALAAVGPAVAGGAYLLLFQTPPRLPASAAETPHWLWSRVRDPFVVWGLLPAAVVSAGAVLAWYLTWGRLLMGKAGGFAEGPHLDPGATFWWYAKTSPEALSNVLAFAALFGLGFCLIRRHAPSRILALALVSGYVAFGLLWVYRWWYVAAALPFVAAVTAVGLVSLRPRWLATAVSLFVASVAIFVFWVSTWGVGEATRPLAAMLGSPLEAGGCRDRGLTLFCPIPPKRGLGFPYEKVLVHIVDDAECQADGDCTVLVPDPHSWVFEFHLASAWPDASISVLRSPRRPRPGHGDDRGFLKLVWSDYVVSLPGQRPASPSTVYAEAHAASATFPLPLGGLAALVRRTRPLSPAEAGSIVAKLDAGRPFPLVRPMALRCLQKEPGPPISFASARRNARAYAVLTAVAVSDYLPGDDDGDALVACYHELIGAIGMPTTIGQSSDEAFLRRYARSRVASPRSPEPSKR